MNFESFELPDGQKFGTGCLPEELMMQSAPIFGVDSLAYLIPRSEYKSLCDLNGTGFESPYLSYVHNQNGYGMCNASATASAMESQRLKQGLPPVKLSAGDLYNRISGGVDQGSTLQAGIRAAMSQGIASVPVVPYLTWKSQVPGAAQDRPRFRVLEAYLCPTFDHMFSAVLQGFDVISGINWYDSYSRVDSDGWLPPPSGRYGGHAVHGYKATYRQKSGLIEYGIWHKNSWSVSWGRSGFGVFPERCYPDSARVYGWWAVRAVVDEGGVVPSPTVPVTPVLS